MKKIIAVLAAGGLLAASIPQVPVAAAEIPALTDIVSLQKWILGESESTPTDGQTWDLNADGTVNITDLCQMKRQYTTIPVQNPLNALTGMDYQTAVANAYISKSEYGYQIAGNLKSTIEEHLEIHFAFLHRHQCHIQRLLSLSNTKWHSSVLFLL